MTYFFLPELLRSDAEHFARPIFKILFIAIYTLLVLELQDVLRMWWIQKNPIGACGAASAVLVMCSGHALLWKKVTLLLSGGCCWIALFNRLINWAMSVFLLTILSFLSIFEGIRSSPAHQTHIMAPSIEWRFGLRYISWSRHYFLCYVLT